jgi:hypothetical protein
MTDNFTINPEYKPLEEPIKSRHDITTTRESIKELLAHGTPDWIRFPHDYKEFVKESFAAEKENSDRQVAQYRMDDQELLTDAKPRMVHIITTWDFVKKLKDNGIKCFTFNNPLMPQTVGLWARPKYSGQIVYVAYMQVPCMYEWSVLRLDRHGLPNGEDYRGWRTVLVQLIEKEVLTEQEAHRIFGPPTDGIVSRRYRRSLYDYRNGRRFKPAATTLE